MLLVAGTSFIRNNLSLMNLNISTAVQDVKIKFQKEDAENCKYVFTDNGEIVNWQKEFIQRDPRLRATVVTCGESFNMDGAVYTFPAGDTMTGYCCNKYIDPKPSCRIV